MADLQKLIAKQREELGIVKEQHIDVVLGGEKVAVTLRKAQPEEWDALVALNPPRRGIESDAMSGTTPRVFLGRTRMCMSMASRSTLRRGLTCTGFSTRCGRTTSRR